MKRLSTTALRILYALANVSGVGQGVCLLQVRDGMQFPRNETTSNTVLWPIVFMN